MARPKPKPKNLTERVDAIFIHKFWGLIVFILNAFIFVLVGMQFRQIVGALGELPSSGPLSDITRSSSE